MTGFWLPLAEVRITYFAVIWGISGALCKICLKAPDAYDIIITVNFAQTEYLRHFQKIRSGFMDNNLNKNHYDFGIVGFWYGINYGSILTYYALYKTIEDCGYRCLLINKHTNLWDERFYDKKSLANRFFISEKFNKSELKLQDQT